MDDPGALASLLGGRVVIEHGAAGQLPARGVQLDELQQRAADGGRGGRVEEGVAHGREQPLQVAGQLRLQVAPDVRQHEKQVFRLEFILHISVFISVSGSELAYSNEGLPSDHRFTVPCSGK